MPASMEIGKVVEGAVIEEVVPLWSEPCRKRERERSGAEDVVIGKNRREEQKVQTLSGGGIHSVESVIQPALYLFGVGWECWMGVLDENKQDFYRVVLTI